MANALRVTAGLPEIVLTGSVQYAAGSDTDSGQIEMLASPPSDVKVTMHLSGGDRTEMLHGEAGTWSRGDGIVHSHALHNAFTAGAWFSPSHLLMQWAGEAGYTAGGSETENQDGKELLRIRCVRSFAQDSLFSRGMQKATAMELLVDPSTSLPVELDFNAHPDNNQEQDIPVRIVYEDYRPSPSGALEPFHIQKYMQGSLLLDIVIQQAEARSKSVQAE